MISREDPVAIPTRPPEIVELRLSIIETKLAHQSFGPKKVAFVPGTRTRSGRLPVKRNHLVRERRQRRRVPPDPRALVHCNAPTELERRLQGPYPWPTGSAAPAALTDNHSRFILQCR